MGYKDPEKAAEYARQWRAKHPERAREIDEKKRKRQPVGMATERMRIWRIENPEKAKAQADRANARMAQRLKEDQEFAAQQKQKRAEYMADPEVRARRREQWKSWAKDARNRFPERRRQSNLKNSYGLTVEQYDAMVLAQEGRCGLCDGPPNGRVKRLNVDHDHETGVIRMLLCHSCNTGIGALRDDPDLLRAAAEYIEQFRETVK